MLLVILCRGVCTCRLSGWGLACTLLQLCKGGMLAKRIIPFQPLFLPGPFTSFCGNPDNLPQESYILRGFLPSHMFPAYVNSVVDLYLFTLEPSISMTLGFY